MANFKEITPVVDFTCTKDWGKNPAWSVIQVDARKAELLQYLGYGQKGTHKKPREEKPKGFSENKPKTVRRSRKKKGDSLDG